MVYYKEQDQIQLKQCSEFDCSIGQHIFYHKRGILENIFTDHVSLDIAYQTVYKLSLDIVHRSIYTMKI